MIVDSAFRPAWWLPGPHLQTLWPNTVRLRPAVRVRRERCELPDGDFVDIDWTLGRDGPIVVVLHGLEGSIRSCYAAGILRAVERQGWRGALMHFRGCSGEPNRLRRSYHSGETGDLETVIATLRAREPDTPLACIGYSLGGNVLLKWLGEQGSNAPLAAAVAVSVPFDLSCAAARLERGFSRVYQAALLRRLRASVRRKFDEGRHGPLPVELGRLNTFRAFDDAVTAPLHGFGGVDDYYRRSSSRQYLGGIAIPTLILHAADDPFMTADAIPRAKELPDGVILELSPSGGHVGFVGGAVPGFARYYLETRIPAFLTQALPGSVNARMRA